MVRLSRGVSYETELLAPSKEIYNLVAPRAGSPRGGEGRFLENPSPLQNHTIPVLAFPIMPLPPFLNVLDQTFSGLPTQPSVQSAVRV
jgi:hypothetical protein